jgi:multiple sugar transport system substrate-binding protein
MKKIMTVLSLMLLLVGLAACGNKPKTTPEDNEIDLFTNMFDDKTPEQWQTEYSDIIGIDSDANGTLDWQEKPMTITYASDFYDDDDSLNTLFRNAVKWAEQYPNITLVRDDRFKKAVTGDSDELAMEMLVAASQDQSMPDIFYAPLSAEAYDQDLVLDLAPYVRTDSEARAIQENALQFMVSFDRKTVWGIPYMSVAQFPAVNVGMLESLNIPVPDYDWTYEEYEALRDQVGAFTDNGSCAFPGLIDFSRHGLNYFDNVPNGWNGFDVEKQRFDFSAGQGYGAWLTEEANEGNKGWHFFDLSLSEQEAVCGSYGFPWGDGFQAIDNIWMFSLSTDARNMIETRELNIDIYPMPTAPVGGNTSISAYFDALSLGYHLRSDRVKAEAVYDLAKWLSYGEDGTEARWAMIDEDISTYGENVEAWVELGNDALDFPLIHPSTHLMDYIMGWPVTNNPVVMANHPLVKGFDPNGYYAIFNFDAFKSTHFQNQLSNAIAYPRQIPAAARAYAHINVWSDIKERVRVEGYSYNALAPEIDLLLNGYLDEYLRYYNKR